MGNTYLSIEIGTGGGVSVARDRRERNWWVALCHVCICRCVYVRTCIFLWSCQSSAGEITRSLATSPPLPHTSSHILHTNPRIHPHTHPSHKIISLEHPLPFILSIVMLKSVCITLYLYFFGQNPTFLVLYRILKEIFISVELCKLLHKENKSVQCVYKHPCIVYCILYKLQVTIPGKTRIMNSLWENYKDEMKLNCLRIRLSWSLPVFNSILNISRSYLSWVRDSNLHLSWFNHTEPN